jgi:acyl-CoA synthetase (AMP-forming)/AMP-acid ligase II
MIIGNYAVINARKQPKKDAIIFGDWRENFKEYNERINSMANALYDMGVKKGDKVAILSDICPQYAEMYFAVAKRGFVIVPLNYRLAESEISKIINDSEANTLIVRKNYLEKILPMRKQLEKIKNYICIGGETESFLDYEALIKKFPADEPSVKTHEDEAVWLLYTSGTTGRAKGVELTHKGLGMDAIITTLAYDHLEPDDIGLLFAPPHALGFSNTLMTHWYIGSTVVLIERFEPLEVLKAIEQFKITAFWAVPTMLRMMIKHPDFFRYDLSSLRSIFYAGAPISEDLQKEVINAFGPILTQGFGQTESGGPLTFISKKNHLRIEKRRSVGRAYPGVDLRIVDENDNDVPIGEAGEIVFRGDLTMKGYWKAPESNLEVFKGGWVHTGDIGKFDQDGYLYLVDRKKDMIVSGGTNIFSKEVEEVINEHPAVAESAVIGVPDEHWGEVVKAIVMLREGTTLTQDELLEFCKDKMGSYKRPKSVEFVTEFPRNPTGKILKPILREKYRKGLDGKKVS